MTGIIGQENSLWRIFNHLNYFGICISGSNGLVWINSSLKKLLNKKNSQNEIDAFKKLFSKDDDWLVSKCIRDSISGQYIKKNFQVKSDDYTMLEFNFVPINLGASEPCSLILASDITNKKDDSEQIKNFEDILVRQQRMASIGEVISNISHEINNPLFVLYNELDMLEQEIKDDKSIGRIALLRQMALKITETIQSVQSLVRQSESQKLEDVLLGEVIEVGRLLTQRNFSKEKIEFEVCPTDHLPKIKCRRNEIEQAILNLITHSFESTKELRKKDAQIPLYVKIEVNEKLRQIDILIKNNGKKISHELFNKILDSNSIENSFDKSDLAISISNKIMQSHGGGLKLLDQEQDNVFVLTLPKK